MASPAQRMGIQPAAVRWQQGGTRVNAPKPKIDDGTSPSAFSRVSDGASYQQGGPTRDWSSMVKPPPNMGPYAQPGQPIGDGLLGPYTKSNWKGPLGRVPNHHGWAGLQPTVKEWALRILGAFPGLRFSSGFRTPAENAAVNGDPRSGHMEGWKIDLSGPSPMLAAAAKWAQQYGAKVLLHDAGSGYHLDTSWRGVGI